MIKGFKNRCMIFDCNQLATIFHHTKKGRYDYSRYCDEHYKSWAIKLKIKMSSGVWLDYRKQIIAKGEEKQDEN